MLMADDVTPPESGEMTTINARMAREDEAWEAETFMKAVRNSQPFVPANRHLRAPRGANSHHFRSSVACSVAIGPGGARRQTPVAQNGDVELTHLRGFESPAGYARWWSRLSAS